MDNGRFGRVAMMQLRAEDVNDAERTVSGWASTPSPDWYNEVIQPSAFAASLERYLANPLLTWYHDVTEVVGRVLEARIEPAGLWVKCYFAKATQRAQETFGLVAEQCIRGLSVGFNGLYGSPEWGFLDESKRWNWTRADLVEIAVCSLPANSDALLTFARSVGVDTSGWGAPPPVLPEGLDAEEARAFENVRRIRGSSEGIANISAHWSREGGAPSALLGDAVCEAARTIAGVTERVQRAGRVLSDKNRTDVEAARDLLGGVLERDDASRAAAGGKGDAEEAEPDQNDDGQKSAGLAWTDSRRAAELLL